jgi:YfiH family protein
MAKDNPRNDIQYFAFDSFTRSGLTHAVFKRHGGISPKPFFSLNLGGSNGDLRENVIENRKRIFEKIQRPVESLFDVWQVHSDVVLCIDHPRPLDEKQAQADALLTDKSGVTLFMRFADCVPIFLYDPENKVIGLVHAGWQGTVKKIISKTIHKMEDHYHSNPEYIMAGIGPSICVNHYEVQGDVVQQVNTNLGELGRECIKDFNGGTYFDLQRANYLLLRDAGVLKVNLSNVCTACHVEDWFSHRIENGNTGRMGAVIAL